MALLVGILIISLSTSWFLYLLVLVFLGGVIVLIIYIRTLAANEKFKNLKSYWGLSILLVPFILKVPINLSHFKISSSMVSILSLYHYSNFSLLVFLILYLLLALVCVVKLIKFEAGPLIKRL